MFGRMSEGERDFRDEPNIKNVKSIELIEFCGGKFAKNSNLDRTRIGKKKE